MPSHAIRENGLHLKFSRLPSRATSKEIIMAFLRSFLILPEIDINDLYETVHLWEARNIERNRFYFSNHATRNDIGFITKGAIKLYREHEGKEQVVNLFKEGFFGTMKPYISPKSPNVYKALCMEDTTLVTITEQNINKLISKLPVFEGVFRELNENIFLFLENRMMMLQTQSAKERYKNLVQNNAELLIRFNQRDIANFLGMTQETLSRIRNASYIRAN